MKVAVIGGGIIGVTVAHAALERGSDVTIYDPLGLGEAASSGNAGWIADMDVLPLASPKAWRNLPRWMLDPLGPLSIRPAYFPRILPWFIRFALASRPSRIRDAMDAIAAINGAARPAWDRLLRTLRLTEHMKAVGILTVWDDARAFAASRGTFAFQRAHGIAVRELDALTLRSLEPALGPRAVRGVLYETACRVSDPKTLTIAVGNAALARGAHLRLKAVDAVRVDGGQLEVAAQDHLESFDKVVIATGAWSKPLARQLGDNVPLDCERGYNTTLPAGSLGLRRPILFEGHGFVTTPLDTGDRIGGAVEFAGPKAPPNFARVGAMLDKLRLFVPNAQVGGGRPWMGLRPSLPDSLPVIDYSVRSRSAIYAFGHAHHGLTQAAVTAEAVASLLFEAQPAINLEPFSARRFR
jgi:D-amino-acid dehydrogenase